MAEFPNIEPPSSLTEESSLKRLKERSPAGYVMMRPRGSRVKKEFALGWPSMPSSDKETLEAFINIYFASFFVWTHPDTLVPYDVCFKEDSINIGSLNEGVGHWKVSFTLEEI